MSNTLRALLLLAAAAAPAAQAAGPQCTEPELTPDQVRQIVIRERLARTDIPRGYAKNRWEVRRQGCHYVYLEFSLPERPGKQVIIKLNQRGLIVDAMKGH